MANNIRCVYVSLKGIDKSIRTAGIYAPDYANSVVDIVRNPYQPQNKTCEVPLDRRRILSLDLTQTADRLGNHRTHY